MAHAMMTMMDVRVITKIVLRKKERSASNIRKAARSRMVTGSVAMGAPNARAADTVEDQEKSNPMVWVNGRATEKENGRGDQVPTR